MLVFLTRAFKFKSRSFLHHYLKECIVQETDSKVFHVILSFIKCWNITLSIYFTLIKTLFVILTCGLQLNKSILHHQVQNSWLPQIHLIGYWDSSKSQCFNLIEISKVGDHSWGRPEGSLFNSYYTKVWGRMLLLSLDCSTLPLIRTLYCWVLSKEVLSTNF